MGKRRRSVRLDAPSLQLEFDHDLEVALGGKPTLGNIRLLCKAII